LNNAGDTAIDYIHRRVSDKEIYFLRNTTQANINGTCRFRVFNKIPQYWNAETGEIFPINQFSTDKNGITIPLSLAVDGACFIVFTNDTAKQPAMKKGVPLIATKVLYTKKGLAVLDNTSLPNRGAITIDAPWQVRFQKRTESPVIDTFSQLQSWHLNNKDGIKYFSGSAAYHNSFMLTSAQIKNGYGLFLALNNVKEIAEVYLNGHRLGLHWYKNHQFDITEFVRPGTNYIVIEVVNSINNQLIGDAKLPAGLQQMRSNITKLPNAWMSDFKEAKLIEAGLLGPVEINLIKYLIQ